MPVTKKTAPKRTTAKPAPKKPAANRPAPAKRATPATVEPVAKLPSFSLPASGNRTLGDRDFRGRKLVVYFYPRDNTPGCTLEAQDFRDRAKQFEKAGVALVGVSQDTVRSHDGFCAKQDLPFPLLSDVDGTLGNAFGVIKDKVLYGRKFVGIERSTFLFDANGRLARAWRKVRVPGHADEVLEAARAL
ncbi:MAG TPA: peroxiredoxin [Xanthomonadales bacterium]|nr:peroxiredoxin [Xanthomonadales bacterium]